LAAALFLHSSNAAVAVQAHDSDLTLAQGKSHRPSIEGTS
jgi:hypothetical protein